MIPGHRTTRSAPWSVPAIVGLVATLLVAGMAPWACTEQAPPPAEELAPRIEHAAGLTLVLVRPGDFRMGSPLEEAQRDADEHPRQVRVERPFYLSTTEITQAAYESITGANPSKHRGPRRPVDSVTRADAQAFTKKLAELHGGTWRLPTETEWEYACRAGTETPYSFGQVLTAAKANVRDRHGEGPSGLKKSARSETADVGSYEPNAWGLHDMHGNVWEWTSDTYAAAPGPPEEGETRGVLRGGAWNFVASAARSATRMSMDPERRYDCNGFRVVLEVED